LVSAVLTLTLLTLTSCAGTVEKDVNAALETLDKQPATTHEDHLRDRASDSLKKWSQAAVEGAMQGWANPELQEKFRKQTGDLAQETVNRAVDGALVGLTNPEHIDKLKQQLNGIVLGLLQQASADLDNQLAPALRRTTRSAVDGVTDGIRSDLGPELRNVLQNELAPGLARGIRDDVGPALRDVIKSDLGPALSSAIEQNLRPSVQAMTNDLRQVAAGTGADLAKQAQATTRVITIGAAVLLLIALAIAIVFWRKAKLHQETIALLTGAIKTHENAPGVQDVLKSVRTKSLGTAPGDNLHRFLTARPTLRAHAAD
jgi:hypothetical protein